MTHDTSQLAPLVGARKLYFEGGWVPAGHWTRDQKNITIMCSSPPGDRDEVRFTYVLHASF